MKAFGIQEYGGNEVVECLDRPMPEVGPNDILVQVKAASVNPIDYKLRQGMLKLIRPFAFPLYLGHDCSGVVTQVGTEVSQFKVGDEVYARVPKHQTGTFSEYVAIEADKSALKPQNISHEEAASIPLVALTAWQALVVRAGVAPGAKVYIPAGSGGVGSIAIQVAKNLGAYVATSTSTSNLGWVKALGADLLIDYKQEEVTDRLKDYDIVLDTLGGKEQPNALKVLKPGGKLISIVGPPTADVADEFELGFGIKCLLGLVSWPVRMRAHWAQVDYQFLFMRASGQQLAQMTGWIEAGKLRPIIDKVYPFNQTPDAIAYLEKGHAKGKVVVALE